MTMLIPPVVIYIGLIGCVLALLVATAQNNWSPRVFLILALRLAIGWHFLFEGMHKIHSHMVGPTDSNKVFTSEPYFAMADGPLGPIMRKQIGDPAELIKTRIVARKDAPKSDADFVEAVPTAVASEWDAYVALFSKTFLKSESVKPDISKSILAKYGKWITGVEPGKESKMRYLQTDVPFTVPQRLAHLDKLVKQLDDLLARQKAGFGQGYGYDQSRITAAKTELRTARTEILADSDAMLLDMKRELFALTAGEPLSSFKLPSEQLSDEKVFAELIAFKPTGEGISFENTVPSAVKAIWTSYLDSLQNIYSFKDTKVKDTAEYPRYALAEWFSKNWVKKVAEYQAVATDKDKGPKAKEALLGELDKQFNTFRTMVTGAVPADTLSGLVVEKKVKPIEEMDKFTMWFIAMTGACILFGFLTPISCLAAAGFLVLTYLTHPPFPWLPLPPNTEGNPLFINKNVIEALALLVIAAHPTGRWMGLDAIWTWVIGLRRTVK